MAVRVAELETLFTGNLDDFETKAKTVEARQKGLDGQTSTVDIVADAVTALDGIGDVQDLLDEIDGETAEVEVTTDTDRVISDLDDVADQLEDLGDQDTTVKLDVDADGVREGLGRAEDG